MIRVLVVDDDFMVAKVHSGYVNRTPGFTVIGAAHSGTAALRMARDERPDLILLDIYLPDIDGLTVLRELRADPATVDIDVVVITAARDVDTIRGSLHGGALHYLIKPFSYAALRDQLDHVSSLPPETGTTVGATRRRATRGRRRVQWTSPAHGIAAEGTHRANGGSGADGADRTPGGAVGDRMRPRHPTLPAECPAVPGAFRGNRPGRGAVALRRYGPPRTPLPLAGMTSKPLPMRVG